MALNDYYWVEPNTGTTVPTWTTTTYNYFVTDTQGEYRATPADLRMTMFMEDILHGRNKPKADRTLLSDDAPDMDV